MFSQTMQVPDISCSHCVNNIISELQEMPGIASVSGNVPDKTITVTWRQPASLNDIITVLKEIGYPASL